MDIPPSSHGIIQKKALGISSKMENRPVGRKVTRLSSGTGGLRFKSLAGQIEQSVANGSTPLRHFF